MRFRRGASALRGVLAATWKGTKSAHALSLTSNPEFSFLTKALNLQCATNSTGTTQTSATPVWVGRRPSETRLSSHELQRLLDQLEASLVFEHTEEYERLSEVGSSVGQTVADVDDYVPLDRPVDIRAEFDDDTSSDEYLLVNTEAEYTTKV